MKQLFDYLPVVTFFGLYFLGGRDIYLATWGIIIACTVQVTLGLVIWRKVERMHLAVFLITLVFGGLTLFMRDDTFIKWRPSIISFVLGAILLIGQLLRDRNLLQRLLEALMSSTLGYIAPLSRRDWTWLNFAFISYFVFIGLLNLFIAYRFSTDFWVNFKLFGFTAIQIVFYALVILFIYRRIPAADRKRLFSDSDDSNGGDEATAKDEDKDAVRDNQ